MAYISRTVDPSIDIKAVSTALLKASKKQYSVVSGLYLLAAYYFVKDRTAIPDLQGLLSAASDLGGNRSERRWEVRRFEERIVQDEGEEGLFMRFYPVQ